MQNIFKKLTGKNDRDGREAAQNMVDNADSCLFQELVDKDSFLFDFVKQNVSKRIIEACTKENYRNLIQFMKYYSPSFEESIVAPLAKFADEEITALMIEKLENGTEEEKTYAAKFFSYIKNPLAIELLRKNCESDNEFLAANCASSLAVLGDTEIYNKYIEKLCSDDEFEVLNAVRFLVSYGNKDAVENIIEAMKTSSFAENIAGEIPYLINIFELFDRNFEDGLILVNFIVNALGEILGLSQVFDFQLFEVFEKLISLRCDSRVAVVLLNAIEKFDTLTENDEYLFDEDKNTKNEVCDIKKLLSTLDKKELKRLVPEELTEDSPFVFTALDFSDDLLSIRELLKCNNQTVILKTAEVLKSHNNLDDTAKTVALLKITDDNIKSIIRAL